MSLRVLFVALFALNFEFWQMRVSESKGCLLASKGSKECRPNIYTKQATPVPSGSILDKTTFCQF